MIPPCSVVDSLLHLFFIFVYEFLLIFHRPTFEKWFEKLWTSSVPSGQQNPHEQLEDRIFLSTLNVYFVLGAYDVQLPSDVDHEHETADLKGVISRGLVPGASTFRLNVQLLSILHAILDIVYINSRSQLADMSGARDLDLPRNTLELIHQLDGFLASLPEHPSSFIVLSPSAYDSCFHKLSLHEQASMTSLVSSLLSRMPLISLQGLNLLTTSRFLYARIVLVQPLLLVIGSCNSWYPCNLELNVSKGCCSLCLVPADLLALTFYPDGIISYRLANWHTAYCNIHPSNFSELCYCANKTHYCSQLRLFS
jgi:hypothetical protein